MRARKDEHLDIVLERRTAPSRRGDAGFGALRFEHVALPEIDCDTIDLTSVFLGRRLSAPLLISSMTGGPDRAARINRHLAEAAEALGIALAVGSQRVALSGGGVAGITADLRRHAPSIPLIANLGGAQLVSGYGLDEARRAVDMIEADALVIHLNPLQEALQPEGDRAWSGVLAAIERLAAGLPVPLAVKEVGCGLSGRIAHRLVEAGVQIIDVAGAGGTSWAAIEAERAATAADRAVATAFADWGIPTAEAVRAVRSACPTAVVIASGGVRDGVDVAKAIRLGADLAGQAAATLDAALISPTAVVTHFETVIRQLRVACFCTGSADIAALRTARATLDPG
ncbi:type 2 isopentenyl-diphosphate Delta-isomerase [Mongoliimonas terrestris]|uniref:type 2 isopentenyl-diphosphate Delta-isomerase n=1 Tax=Mongoliimonas terrestris TaxID=1709001 RepID=UPI0009499B5E|nr:type 2 isopentenyl-diphosphate Delta-isomerase [Mongoliimonas terrestris]